MKAFLISILVLLTAGGIIYFVPSFHTEAVNLLTYNACNSPLPYRLGSIDPKFGLTNDEVLADVAQAGAIWSTAEGKNLFALTPDAKLSINFVYDQRQALDTSINQLHDNLTQKDQSLTQEIAQYESDFSAFQQKLNTLNATIEKYNQEGGAPPSVYNDLIKQQDELSKEGEALNQRAKALKLTTNDYNANVATLNSDISQFQNVLAQKPEEGLYNGGDNTITIYFSDNKNELIHTLTHELGHALGMPHVKDPNAIMYPYTTSLLTVTADDMKELSYVCRNQSSIVHYLQQFDIWLIMQAQSLRKQFVK